MLHMSQPEERASISDIPDSADTARGPTEPQAEDQLPAASSPDAAASTSTQQALGEQDRKQRKGVKLFIGGLSWATTEEAIKDHFGQYGEVQSVVVMVDRTTQRPRGFAFCTVGGEDVAERICKESHVLDGRTVDVKHSVPQEQKPKARRIFVGGLAPDTTEGATSLHFTPQALSLSDV